MERSVEVVAAILFGVIGLSHILQPRAWVEFFTFLLKADTTRTPRRRACAGR